MAERWILQFCHCHYGPFLDVARQYSSLFKGSEYKVLTVYLTGEASCAAREGSGSDEVIFLDFKSREVRGLKIGAILALKRIIASRDIALIIAHRFKPIYIACLASALPVIGVHHAFGDYDRAPRRWFVEAFRKRLALLAVSDAVRDDLRKRLPQWPPDRIETLHNRLDSEAVRAEIVPREQARQILNIPPEALVIANVGRLHPDKDQATLIAAFALALPKLPPATLLTIAGSGPLEAALRKLAQELELGDRIRFLGQIPQARRLFSAFDLFVLTSDHEPFGMVLLEAMAADVPVMATDCGGAPEVVGRQEMLFGLRNSGQLADLLVSFFAKADDSYHHEASSFNALRLDDAFSDEVARRRFFLLPMVQAVLSPEINPDAVKYYEIIKQGDGRMKATARAVKPTVALVAFDSLGDGLIYLMMAENLQLNGFDVTCYGNIAHQMRRWLCGLNIRPYPEHSEFEREFDAYDLVIMSPPQFLRDAMDEQKTETLREKYLLICQKTPENWRFDHTDRLRGTLSAEAFEQFQGLMNCSGSIRFKNFADESAVEMTLHYMRQKMHLESVSKEVRLTPPDGLLFRRHPRRIIISPDSAGPEKKNWTPSSFIGLCHRLKARGYKPEIVVAPKHHARWASMASNVFATPSFPDIDQLSAHIYESGAVIANDSGNGHLASFLKIPVVTIYRRKNPFFHWRPDWGPGIVVCPMLTIPWFGGPLWKPFVRTSEIVSALEKLL